METRENDAGGATNVNARRVTVNGAGLDMPILKQLEAALHLRLNDGDYWYDVRAGLWGARGGPALGQLLPGLTLGGPLDFAASGGNTNITLNGRAIHPLEVQHIIATYGFALPGRYWLDAHGNLGLEGGPILFNIHTGRGAQQGKGWYHAGPGGYMASDGNSIGYTAPGGESFVCNAT